MPKENGNNVLSSDVIAVALTAESYLQDSSRMFPNLCWDFDCSKRIESSPCVNFSGSTRLGSSKSSRLTPAPPSVQPPDFRTTANDERIGQHLHIDHLSTCSGRSIDQPRQFRCIAGIQVQVEPLEWEQVTRDLARDPAIDCFYDELPKDDLTPREYHFKEKLCTPELVLNIVQCWKDKYSVFEVSTSS